MGSTITRSASRTVVVRCVRTTTPVTSWPGMTRWLVLYADSTGLKPVTCSSLRSEPQIPARVGRISAQPSPGKVGVGMSRGVRTPARVPHAASCRIRDAPRVNSARGSAVSRTRARTAVACLSARRGQGAVADGEVVEGRGGARVETVAGQLAGGEELEESRVDAAAIDDALLLDHRVVLQCSVLDGVGVDDHLLSPALRPLAHAGNAALLGRHALRGDGVLAARPDAAGGVACQRMVAGGMSGCAH